MNVQFFKRMFPDAAYFLAVVFHQDWAEDFNSPATAVRGFIDRETAALVKAVVSDLTRLEVTEVASRDLDEILLRVGCYYDYAQQGVSAKEWLKQVAGWLGQ